MQAESDDLEKLVLRFCIRPIDGAFELLAIMDIRARSISFATRPRRPDGPPDHERAGETFSPSPLSDSQTSAGKRPITLADQPKPLAIPLVNVSKFISGCWLHNARFAAALLCQHSPGDPRQLVGESCSQNVGMQALSGAREPDPEAVLRPVRWPQQNDPGCLHEERA